MPPTRIFKISALLTLAVCCFYAGVIAEEPIAAISAKPSAIKGEQILPEGLAHTVSSKESILRLAEFTGFVEVKIFPSTAWEEAKPGQELYMQDSVRTHEFSNARLQFHDNSFIILKEETDVTIEELTWLKKVQKVGVTLNIGQIRTVIKKLRDPSKFEVKTPTATIGVRGTDFFTRVQAINDKAKDELYKLRETYSDETKKAQEALAEFASGRLGENLKYGSAAGEQKGIEPLEALTSYGADKIDALGDKQLPLYQEMAQAQENRFSTDVLVKTGEVAMMSRAVEMEVLAGIRPAETREAIIITADRIASADEMGRLTPPREPTVAERGAIESNWEIKAEKVIEAIKEKEKTEEKKGKAEEKKAEEKKKEEKKAEEKKTEEKKPDDRKGKAEEKTAPDGSGGGGAGGGAGPGGSGPGTGLDKPAGDPSRTGDPLREITAGRGESTDDRNANTATTPAPTPPPVAGDTNHFHDDLSNYRDQETVDGKNGWTSTDDFDHAGWRVEEAAIGTMDGSDHNYLHFHPAALPSSFSSSTNYATYHVDAGARFDSLSLSFWHQIQQNGSLKVAISGNNSYWVDVSNLLRMRTPSSVNNNRWWNAYADLTSKISEAMITNEIYVKFSGSASDTAAAGTWQTKMVDPAVARNDLRYSRDDFSTYPVDSNNVAINGLGNWTSGDSIPGYGRGWTTYQANIGSVTNHNTISFAPSPWPGSFVLGSNYATYHVAAGDKFNTLALAADYVIQPNSTMKTYISGDNSTWVDVTDAIDMTGSSTENDWKNAFADLTSYLTGANVVNDLYVKFTGSASSGSGWGIQVGSIEVTRNEIERALIRNEVREVMEFNTLAQLDDYATRNQDAQDGFVMTDMHGNRVRIAQYLFMPDNSNPADTTVRIVTVNYRGSEAGDLSGITSADYRIKFNIKPPTDPTEFRNLPWNDIFRFKVVSRVVDGTTTWVEKDPDSWGTSNEWESILHDGNPTYWAREFSIKVTNPHNDYFFISEAYDDPQQRTYKPVGGDPETRYLQVEDIDNSREIIAKAGVEIFNHTVREMYDSNGPYYIDGETNTAPGNYVQDPNNYMNDNVHFVDLFWKDSAHTGKIRSTWDFYLIDADGNRMPYETVYTDSTHTTTRDETFKFYSVTHVLNAERLGNLEIRFTCDDNNGNSLITAPIDVVIPQGNSNPNHPGILRYYDNYTHDNRPN